MNDQVRLDCALHLVNLAIEQLEKTLVRTPNGDTIGVTKCIAELLSVSQCLSDLKGG